MGKPKFYTDQDAGKCHPIVEALKKAGHRQVKVEWNDALSRNRGWTIRTDKIPYRKFYGTIPNIVRVIQNLSVVAQKHPQYRDVRFETDDELHQWLDKTATRTIEFEDRGQDLLKIWIDAEGEILHTNAQGDIWCGRFIDTTKLNIEKPIDMWFNDQLQWSTMRKLVVDKIHSKCGQASATGV